MQIKRVTPFIMHVPVTGSKIADSTHSISHFGLVGARIQCASGITGFGFTGTHAHAPSDRLITAAITNCYAPLLEGTDIDQPAAAYHRLFHHSPLLWVGRAGILQLALSAVDVALWDAHAKSLGQPLWAVLCGAVREKVAAYNTDIGWLSFSSAELVDGARRAVDQGFTAVKLKVGSATTAEDVDRCEAVRRAVGESVAVATDANGKWDLPTAQRFDRAAAGLDLYWIEEPLWYDDVAAHRELAATSPIPVALGEQVYTPQMMGQFIDAKAVHYVQPDVTRIGGVTGFLQAAAHAANAGLHIAAHAAEMSQVHVHAAYSLANHDMLEYIPWIAHCFAEPARVESGFFVRPEQPGASSTPTEEALERYGVKP